MGLKVKERKGMQIMARPFYGVDKDGKIGLVLEAYDMDLLVANQMMILDPTGKILARKKDAIPPDHSTISVEHGDNGKFFVLTVTRDISGYEDKIHAVIYEFDAKLNVGRQIPIRDLGGMPAMTRNKQGQLILALPLGKNTEVAGTKLSRSDREDCAVILLDASATNVISMSMFDLNKGNIRQPSLFASDGKNYFLVQQVTVTKDDEEYIMILVNQFDGNMRRINHKWLVCNNSLPWMELYYARVTPDGNLEIGAAANAPVSFEKPDEFFISKDPNSEIATSYTKDDPTFTYGFIVSYDKELNLVSQSAMNGESPEYPRPRYFYPIDKQDERITVFLPEFRQEPLSQFGKIQYRIKQGKKNTNESPLFILMKR